MIILKQTEVCICDACQEEEANEYSPCIGCGKHFCYDCFDANAVRYQHGVYVSGSGDGYYCRECDEKMKDDPLHQAYVVIKELRAEGEAMGREFERRRKSAESKVEELCRD